MPHTLTIIVNELLDQDGITTLLKNENIHNRPRFAFIDDELYLWQQDGMKLKNGEPASFLELFQGRDSLSFFSCLGESEAIELCRRPWNLNTSCCIRFEIDYHNEWAPNFLSVSRTPEFSDRTIHLKPLKICPEKQNLYADPIQLKNLDENKIARLLSYDFQHRALCLPPRRIENLYGLSSHELFQSRGIRALRHSAAAHLEISQAPPALGEVLRLSLNPVVSDCIDDGAYISIVNSSKLNQRNLQICCPKRSGARQRIMQYRTEFITRMLDCEGQSTTFGNVIRSLAGGIHRDDTEIVLGKSFDLKENEFALKYSPVWIELFEKLRLLNEEQDVDADDIENVESEIEQLRQELYKLWTKSQCKESFAFYTRCIDLSVSEYLESEYLLSCFAASDHPALVFCLLLCWPSLKCQFQLPVVGHNSTGLGHFDYPFDGETLSDCFEAFFELIQSTPSSDSIRKFGVQSGILSPDRLMINEQHRQVIVSGSHFLRLKNLLNLALPLNWQIVPGCFLEDDEIAIDFGEDDSFGLGLLV